MCVYVCVSECVSQYEQVSVQRLVLASPTSRAYRLQRRGHVTSNLAKFKSRLKIVEFLNMHSAVQTADVTIISYKPLSHLNFARYTQHYGSYMPFSPLASISPCYMYM